MKKYILFHFFLDFVQFSFIVSFNFVLFGKLFHTFCIVGKVNLLIEPESIPHYSSHFLSFAVHMERLFSFQILMKTKANENLDVQYDKEHGQCTKLNFKHLCRTKNSYFSRTPWNLPTPPDETCVNRMICNPVFCVLIIGKTNYCSSTAVGHFTSVFLNLCQRTPPLIKVRHVRKATFCFMVASSQASFHRWRLCKCRCSRVGRKASLLSVSRHTTHCGTSTPFFSIATKPYLMYSASYLRFFSAIVRIVFHANVQYNFIDDVNTHRR
ncbi:hypothetical protein T02_4127 [Trichinella nativa]|uniref:Uncharacterized protein n=1 Tax=Trichinella nativa TaxID=6335 RepID=A0A0V1LQU8_9BILA|nr:hypothetical protein T02_4127 [Trichinella nativa]